MRRCANCFKEIADKRATCTCGFDNSKIKTVPGAIKPARTIEERYYIGSVLGQGGFGITYKGFDLDLDRVIAIKEYYPKNNVQRGGDGLTVEPSDRGEFKKGLNYFTDEAKALAKFQGHANIVSVQNYFRSNNTSYMVMEFMEGKTVREILRGGRAMPSDDSVSIILGVLEGLIACHKQNLIHRDLTPDNIYITSGGKVKILDFGSARQTKEGEDNEFTQILKESYAPIEQYQKSGAQGPYTDIYSVGATFYRLLTGKPPPYNATDRIIDDRLDRPSAVNSKLKISVQVENVLMKAMEVKPGDRYQTVEAFKKELIKAVNDPKPVMAKPIKKSNEPSKQELKNPLFEKPKVSETRPKVDPEPAVSKIEPIIKPKKASSVEVSESKVSIKAKQKSPDEKSSISMPAIVAGIAFVALVVGYQIINPSADPLSVKDSGTRIAQQKSPDRDDLLDGIKTQEPDKIIPPIAETPIATKQSYQLKINIYPENVNAIVKVLETKDPYEYGQIISEGKYTIQAWASGYRIKLVRDTLLNRNRTIDIDLEKLRAPPVSTMNDFYTLINNPTEEESNKFEKNHKRFKPLKEIYGLANGDDSKISEISRLARAGDAESNFLLGVMNLLAEEIKPDSKGYLNEANVDQAKQFLQKSYEEGYKPASLWLAKSYSCFLTNKSSKCNDRKSKELFQEFAYEIPLAEFMQAQLLFQQGNNSRNALNLAESSLSAGVIHANHLIGDIAFESNNLKKSVQHWQLAAKEGNTKSMIRLASIASTSSKNETKSWLRKAYDQGDVEAGIFLAVEAGYDNPNTFFTIASEVGEKKLSQGYFLKGWAYYKGIGTKASESSALYNFSQCKTNINCNVLFTILNHKDNSNNQLNLLEKSLVELNSTNNRKEMIPDVLGEINFYLGLIYTNKNFKYNFNKAIQYFKESAKYKNTKASDALCYAYANGKGVKKNEKQAFTYCYSAYVDGSEDILTLNYLGKSFEQGKGVPVNLERSKAFFNRACLRNDGAGCCNLAKVYNSAKDTKLRDESLIRAKQNKFSHCDLIIGLE